MEIKDQVEQIAETLPPPNRPTLAEFMPDPLGPVVEGERTRRQGGNVNEIAVELAANAIPVEGLPPAVAEARQALDSAEEAKSAAQAELDVQMAAWRRYQAARETLAEKRKIIGNAEFHLARCEADIKDFPKQFATWPTIEQQHRWQAVVGRVQSVIFAERMVKILPPWIAEAKKEMARLELEVETMRAEYDFSP